MSIQNIKIAKEWLNKSRVDKQENDVMSVMNRFFSLYVAYNALYSIFRNYKTKDRACATTEISKYLKKHKIKVLNDSESTILKMIEPVKNDLLKIYGNESSIEHQQDDIILEKIYEDINNYRAILNFIYGIRINMFHGKKQIIAQQSELLNPANTILENLVEVLIDKISIDEDLMK